MPKACRIRARAPVRRSGRARGSHRERRRRLARTEATLSSAGHDQWDAVPELDCPLRRRDYLGVHKATVEKGGLAIGDSVEVTIELDTEPREIDIPGELQRAPEANAKAKTAWDALSPSHKREHARAVADAKKAGDQGRPDRDDDRCVAWAHVKAGDPTARREAGMMRSRSCLPHSTNGEAVDSLSLTALPFRHDDAIWVMPGPPPRSVARTRTY